MVTSECGMNCGLLARTVTVLMLHPPRALITSYTAYKYVYMPSENRIQLTWSEAELSTCFTVMPCLSQNGKSK